jgi:hypothetical protein
MHSVCGACVPAPALVACGGARSGHAADGRRGLGVEVACSYSCGPMRVHDDLADVPVWPTRAAMSSARNVPGAASLMRVFL